MSSQPLDQSNDKDAKDQVDDTDYEQAYRQVMKEVRLYALPMALICVCLVGAMLWYCYQKSPVHMSDEYFGNKVFFAYFASIGALTPFAFVGFLWWSGLLIKMFDRTLFRIGILISVALVGMVMFIQSWHDIRRLYADVDKRLGMFLAFASACFLVTACKIIVLSIAGRPHRKFRGSYKPAKDE